MAKKELSKELLDDIFAIPKGQININDGDDESDDVVKSELATVPFDEKIKGVNNELEKIKVSVADFIPKDVVATIEVKEEPVVKNEEPSIEFTQQIPIKDDFVVVETKVENITIDKENTKEELEKEVKLESKAEWKSESDETDDETDETEPVNQLIPIADTPYFQFKNGKYCWKFTPNDSRFKYFYNEKKNIVSNLIRDNEIIFEKYYKELREVDIDVGVDSYDSEEVAKKINEVMKWRDRVKYIQLHVNSQYFGFSVFENLLKGVLLRVENFRGKQQEGVFYEHMSDFIGYGAELEGLFKSAEIVSKHLDAAYASLSRQIAIAQPYQEADRTTSSVPRQFTKEFSRFDPLPKNANVTNDVVSDNLKEAEKSAEPLRKGWGVTKK